ncbi:MAG: hypothetical protein INH41_21970 [Myxococcaceae bacterium]|nr:hypothetical protein [Myxococcaceae bacterium]
MGQGLTEVASRDVDAGTLGAGDVGAIAGAVVPTALSPKQELPGKGGRLDSRGRSLADAAGPKPMPKNKKPLAKPEARELEGAPKRGER